MGRNWSILVALGALAPPAVTAWQSIQNGDDYDKTFDKVQRIYTGYSFKGQVFMPTELAKGWGPMLLGALGHKLAGKLGINKALPKGINF